MNIEKVYFNATDGMELVGLLHKGTNNTKKSYFVCTWYDK